MQNATQDAALLDCDGEMATRIREHDWSATSLGPIAGWPATLRTTVALILRSPVPIVTLWGEAGVMIYNDAYSEVAGARHPRLLGSNVREGWPEVWSFNDNVVRRVFGRGESLSYRDQELELDRGKGAARAWMNLDYSPVTGDDGTRLGVIAIVVETTQKVLADRALRHERVRLQQMYDQSPSFMALLEGPQHRFGFVNPAYQALVGPRDLVGRTVAEAMADAVDQGYLDLLDRVYATGKPHRSTEAPFDVRHEASTRPERRYLDFVYQPIADADGRVTGIFVNGVDVTERVAAQEAIRASERQFRTFAQAMPNHVWTARPNGDLDWFNERVSAYTGRSDAELAGTAWPEVVHPEDRERAMALWGAAVAGGDRYETEFRMRRADGNYRWHLVRALPIRNERGEVTRWIGSNTDIDEQKRTEAQTLQDRDRLWNLSQDLMLVCDYEGVVTAVNPTATRLLGWEQEAMVGQKLQSFLHVEDLPRTAAELGRLSQGATTFAFENRYRCRDGSYRLLDWTAVPDEGRIHAVARDITEERRLARDRERVWNLSPVFKIIATTEGAITSVNPAWSKQLGWDAAATVGRHVLDFVALGDREAVAAKLAKLKAGSNAGGLQCRMIARDGRQHHVAWTAVVETDTIYAFGRDITAETEAAEALARAEAALRQAQKMEAIGQLTGGIAHDFNNLLQVISGNLQFLHRMVGSDGAAHRHLENAMEGVRRGSRLASQLLAFGRRQPLAPRVVNPGRLIRGMDELLRHTLGEAIEIETIVAGGLWNTLIDPVNLENAILNLAINARDAMEGQGKLTIEAGNAFLDDRYVRDHEDVAPGQYVLLAMTDTGSGMTPEVLEKVYDPFFTTKAEGKGSGLGLSMVYGFVKQSGGHVKIYSEPGEGTTIRLYLPRSSQAEDAPVSTDTGPVTGGSEMILVAEDDPAVRDIVVETLRDLGYKVLQAADAQSALAAIESGIAIDLLFTDVVMPGPMKAPELARRATRRLPGLKVLFTSGYTENSIVHAGRLDEGVELLSKPYSREDLARKIRQQLGPPVGTEAGAAHPQAASAGPAAAPAAPNGLTVLVCEDDALIRMATADMLADLGCTVLEAAHAEAALDHLARHRIDVLLTDVGLPGISGVALAQQARARVAALPVVFATGRAEIEGVVPDARTRLLLKPYSLEGLRAAVVAVSSAGGHQGR
ncbi:PAS domain S-box protein [Plastorhodobacter daqingensis]|uniref:histidine kinase n=1 Tax=Plastorhodobacter daqingensis TaxID=1387281 RepID=A0ABW2UJ41_9RHOB